MKRRMRVLRPTRRRPLAKETPVEEPRDDRPVEFREGQSVELVIGDRTEIGYKAMIDGLREGMLYKNEIFQTLRRGQSIAGFIKKVREDGKIDLCLQLPGPEKVDEVSQKILEKITKEGGFIPVTDKSRTDTIYGLFGVSKKTFKKAIGALYKRRLILIEENGIRLVQDRATD